MHPHLQDFSYTIHKNRKVILYWQGKQVMILKGSKADKFISKVRSLSEETQRLYIAKITGNFKRGNERLSHSKSKNL